MQPPFTIAIDGPMGVGKSTVAKLIAQKLGFTYIDTGAMYRAVAYYNLQNKLDITDASSLEASLKHINIELRDSQAGRRVFLNGSDITDHIRTQEISEATSVVSTNATVRAKLVKMQQQMAEHASVVMDGRDIGSAVLPNAQLKIYLDATPEIRTRRRMQDLGSVDFDQILQQTVTRDHRDKTRAASPLVQTSDAIYIDTGDMTIEEVVNKIYALYKAF